MISRVGLCSFLESIEHDFLVFFKNEGIFIQLDELDKLDKITRHYDPFTVSHKHRRHFGVMVKVADCCASNLGSIPHQVCEFFEIFILLNSSN